MRVTILGLGKLYFMFVYVYSITYHVLLMLYLLLWNYIYSFVSVLMLFSISDAFGVCQQMHSGTNNKWIIISFLLHALMMCFLGTLLTNVAYSIMRIEIFACMFVRSTNILEYVICFCFFSVVFKFQFQWWKLFFVSVE